MNAGHRGRWQYLLVSAAGDEFLYYLSDCLTPEEEFYSTVLFSQEIIYGTVLTKARNYHFIPNQFSRDRIVILRFL
jgi:hypothetical protein